MDFSGCPPWIDPGNACRIRAKSAKFRANTDYGFTDIAEQENDIWVDRQNGYSLDRFRDDMSSKLIWGRGQTMLVWGVDVDSGSEWKITNNIEFEQFMAARWNEKMVHVNVEVVEKDDIDRGSYQTSCIGTSGLTSGHATSAVGNADVGETSSPDLPTNEGCIVDWSTLVILADPELDGDAYAVADEDLLYEALGFKDADELGGAGAASGEAQIPPISSDILDDMRDASNLVDDHEPSEPICDWDRDNPDMSVGILYPSMSDFRLAVRQHAIVHEFELGIEKSDKERYRGYCKANGCPWIIRARTQADKSVRIQINSNQHTCASTSRVCGTMASQAWVAERSIPLLKKKPGMGAKEVRDVLQDKYKVIIPYHTVWYGRQRAADKLFGKWDDSFDWLYRFKAEIEKRSPGSVVEIDTVCIDGEVHFKRFFCAFKASIDGFLEGCRPYISIDSTALNGQWNGHLPAAQALDGHNWMFPLAFGLFDSETTENWVWFMEMLGKAIGQPPILAVCSDACKGLAAAVKKVFPWAEHRECFRHLMDNMKKNFHGAVYAKYMWPAARAYTTKRHNDFLDKVLQTSPDVQKWLDQHHNLLWARCKFSTEIKCDYINNNLAECWNAWIKEFKDLPVDCLADAIREKTVVLFEKRRRISRALSGTILPAVVQQLNAASKGLGHLKVTKGHPDQAEVSEIYKDKEVIRHVVYLNKHSCTCREWEVTGRPCPHALAVITTDRQPDMEKYVHMAYSVQKLQAAYRGIIPNITDKSQWPQVEKGFKLLPPVAKKRGVGRQKKNRFLSCLERTTKARRQVKCAGCGELGHRKGSAKCGLTGTKKRKRTKKTNTKVGRKKSKKETPTKEIHTPRTRAAAAREAAAALAEAQATAAAPPLPQVAAATPLPQVAAPTPPRSTAVRRLVLEAPTEPIPITEGSGAKKLTPKRKMLAKKVKKTSQD